MTASSRKLLSAVLVALSLATAPSALAYDLLPPRFSFTKTSDYKMQMSPTSGEPPGRPVDSLYFLNKQGTLSDIGALSQWVSFRVSWLGSGPNILTQSVGDHIVVGLNHRYLASLPGNRFVGVTIGLRCVNQPGNPLAAIQIEWKDQERGLQDTFSSCYFPPPGTTSLRFDFTATYAGYATLHIYDGAGNHLHSIYDNQPAFAGYAQTPMGAGVVGLGCDPTAPGNTCNSNPYQMSMDVLGHGFFIWF